ncbi:hypothetical protein [Candidatus Sororendozoicomonas aggregata]|uniref:hypothetical protein n=1 Tax=Candidatus Sororendozoicomonas aggregata TaxID=3073239 RepID=UPI002ED3F1DF
MSSLMSTVILATVIGLPLAFFMCSGGKGSIKTLPLIQFIRAWQQLTRFEPPLLNIRLLFFYPLLFLKTRIAHTPVYRHVWLSRFPL